VLVRGVARQGDGGDVRSQPHVRFIIATGVATVLHFAAGLPYLVAFGSVTVSEVILLFLGNTLLVRRV
jgi:uncharacterized membrane protein